MEAKKIEISEELLNNLVGYVAGQSWNNVNYLMVGIGREFPDMFGSPKKAPEESKPEEGDKE